MGGSFTTAMSEVKIFNRWSTEGIQVADPGLRDYISLVPVIVPKTGARYAKSRFHKSRISIVERLMNKLMVPGHKSKKHKLTSGQVTGKSQSAYKIVYDALSLIEQRTKQNPIAVLVKAIENAAPREEIITIEYGGARYPKATECSPQRRIDLALRYITQGPFQKSWNTKKGFVPALAEEIINAYMLSQASSSVSKKLEIERQADTAR